jgi:S-adenosylmethionine-dependent methyltransferase
VEVDIRPGSGIPARQRAVWQTLVSALAAMPTSTADVLDCGGGTGTFAVPLASAGATVTVVDISVDALATLQRRAAEAGVASRVRAVQGDVEGLPEVVAASSFDLVLAHGILDVVDDMSSAMRGMATSLRPNGLVSVLVGNPVAAVFARALNGELAAALDELRAVDYNERVAGPAAVQAACAAAGLVVEQVHGANVFADLVPGAALDLPGAVETLAELEAEAGSMRPFLDIAARVHVLARRPA